MGWEWEIFLAYGNPMGNRHFHMWESCGKSLFPHVGILWEIVISTCGNPVGNHHSHMWESYGNSHRNPVGMGWEWE